MRLWDPVRDMSAMVKTQDDPRVCILSQRLVRPQVVLCSAYEFEDVICEVDSADLVVPEPVPRLQRYSRLFRILSRHTPFEVSPRPALPPVTIERRYDLFVYLALSPIDLRLLKRCRGWREHARVCICYIEEIWKDWLERYSGRQSPIHILKDFDHIFASCQGTVSALERLIGRPCHYVAPASDAIRFYPPRPHRGIDVYYMGRRSPVTHRALKELADAGRISYLYDSRSGLGVMDTCEHRKLLAGTLSNTRYFIVHPAKADRQDHTAGQEELGFRYFEGAAGGTVMLGSLPRVETSSTYFDWPDAVVEMPYDHGAVGDLMAELAGQPERVNRIRCDNVVHTLRRHDWVHRWAEILEQVGMEATPGMARRTAQLEELAGRTDVTSFSESIG